MDVYVYQAALLCDECGVKRQHALTTPIDPDDESTWDSGDYPKGPYPDGGGEADSPQHCDHCGEFLENPLTDDGRTYVVEALNAFRLDGSGDPEVMDTWRSFYGLRPTPVVGVPDLTRMFKPENWDRAVRNKLRLSHARRKV